MLNDKQKSHLSEVWTALQDAQGAPWSLVGPIAGMASAGADLVLDLTTLSVPVIVAMPRAWRVPPGLTPRQAEVCTLLAQGLTNKAIARRLGLSPATVKDHVHAILSRLSLPGRAALIAALHGGHSSAMSPPPAIHPMGDRTLPDDPPTHRS